MAVYYLPGFHADILHNISLVLWKVKELISIFYFCLELAWIFFFFWPPKLLRFLALPMTIKRKTAREGIQSMISGISDYDTCLLYCRMPGHQGLHLYWTCPGTHTTEFRPVKWDKAMEHLKPANQSKQSWVGSFWFLELTTHISYSMKLSKIFTLEHLP